jgi:hypothetical protein
MVLHLQQPTISHKNVKLGFKQHRLRQSYQYSDDTCMEATCTIAVLNEVKDLGVVINNDLTFTWQINCMVAKAGVRANLIHRGFIFKDVEALLKAYFT